MSDNIKLIWEPEVYLVSCPAMHTPGVQGFLKSIAAGDWQSDAETPGEFLPEMAGRLCYQSYSKPRPGGNRAYLRHILDVQHHSVLEHSNYGFILAGISRSLSHELVRHRVGLSYSQLSQRYVDESGVAFVIPPAILPSYRCWKNWKKCSTCQEIIDQTALCQKFFTWQSSHQLALCSYRQLLKELEADIPPGQMTTENRKKCRETARSVLPNCTETKIFVTGNLRAWRHFLELRSSRHADAEIRRLANRLYGKLLIEAPNVFQDYEIELLGDETFELRKKN